jgi:hypothetical protein
VNRSKSSPRNSRTSGLPRPWHFFARCSDGFRVIARKDGKSVKLYSRPGNDLTHRFPLIVEALAELRAVMHYRR